MHISAGWCLPEAWYPGPVTGDRGTLAPIGGSNTENRGKMIKRAMVTEPIMQPDVAPRGSRVKLRRTAARLHGGAGFKGGVWGRDGYARLRRRRWMPGLAVLAAAIAIGACGDTPLNPSEVLSRQSTSANFVYHWGPDDQAPDSVYQERHLEWVRTTLGVVPTQRFQYFKYRDVQQLRALTGHADGTGFAERGNYRFHTVWPQDNHEYVHALIGAEVGTPPALFNEGIAVAHHGASFSGSFDGDPLWNGAPARAQVRAARDAGALPPLDALLENLDFQRVDSDVGYPAAGSFVRYLIDTRGPVPLLSFIARCPREANAAAVRTLFHEAYGEAIDDAWARWLAWL